ASSVASASASRARSPMVGLRRFAAARLRFTTWPATGDADRARPGRARCWRGHRPACGSAREACERGWAARGSDRPAPIAGARADRSPRCGSAPPDARHRFSASLPTLRATARSGPRCRAADRRNPHPQPLEPCPVYAPYVLISGSSTRRALLRTPCKKGVDRAIGRAGRPDQHAALTAQDLAELPSLARPEVSTDLTPRPHAAAYEPREPA